jgi:hypothetical protein
MDYMICSKVGSIDQCKGCIAAKPHKTKIVCPWGEINWNITKFIGFLKFNNGEFYIKMNGKRIPGLILDDVYTVSKNVNKRLVFWVTDKGIIAHRFPMKLQKTH